MLRSERTSNGYRYFDEVAVTRVAHIQELFAAGLCSSKIAQLLPCVGGSEVAIAPDRGLLGELVDAEQRLEQQIHDLQMAREVLQSLIRATRTGTAAELVTTTRRVDRAARGSQGRRVLPPSIATDIRT